MVKYQTDGLNVYEGKKQVQQITGKITIRKITSSQRQDLFPGQIRFRGGKLFT